MSRDRTQASNHFWAAPHRPPLHTPLQNLLQHRRSALSSAQPEPPSRTRPVHRPIIIPHADEGEYGEDGLNYMGHMIAGSLAGMCEHSFMFPADTVKTRLQAEIVRGGAQYKGVMQAFRHITATEGIGGLYRGVTAVVLGAIPGHAVHFAAYEAVKQRLGGSHTASGRGQSGWWQVGADMAAGSCATVLHDAVSTPVDVVKQRMQLLGSRQAYGNTLLVVSKTIYAQGGMRAFFISYPTTVSMNVPVFAAYFATYEGVKKAVAPYLAYTYTNPATGLSEIDNDTFSPQVHCVAGAAAGAVAGACSNPLDVIKTRLQTQAAGEGGGLVGPVQVARDLLQQSGPKGFLKGISARIVYQAPGAAVCWVAYEYMKHALENPFFQGAFLDDDDDHGDDHDHHHHH